MEAFVAIVQAIGAVATCAAAIVAFLALKSWRDQMVGRRRFEVSEETLRLFYKARRAMKVIRSPGGYVGEGSEFAKAHGSTFTDDQLERADAALATQKRIHDHRDLFAEMETQEATCLAMFGPSAGEPFEKYFKALRLVSSGSQILIQAAKRPPYADRDSDDSKWTSRIWASDDSDDEIAPLVDEAVADAEKFCRPWLADKRLK